MSRESWTWHIYLKPHATVNFLGEMPQLCDFIYAGIRFTWMSWFWLNPYIFYGAVNKILLEFHGGEKKTYTFLIHSIIWNYKCKLRARKLLKLLFLSQHFLLFMKLFETNNSIKSPFIFIWEIRGPITINERLIIYLTSVLLHKINHC